MKIVFCTFSKYVDIAKLTANSICNNFPNNQLHIITDEVFETDNQINFFKLKEDFGWVKNLETFLSELDSDEQIILTMDDLFITGSSPLLKSIIRNEYIKEYDSVRLYDPPNVRISSAIDSDFCNISNANNDRYPISCMFCIFKVSFLRHLLKDEIDAWSFEKNAYKKLLDYKTASIPFNAVTLRNIIVKGDIVSSRLHDLKLNNFKKMSIFKLMKYKLVSLLSFIRNKNIRKIIKYLFQ
tara:strand:- start:2558 stop:3277 length:720 start_codon:yes stop_codon:yes gene_type:complete